MAYLFLTAVTALVDLGIKEVIEKTDGEKFPMELEGTKGIVMLHKNHNDGLPFGFLRERTKLVRQIPFVMASATAGIFAWLYPRKGYVPEKLGLALVLGGGLSNLTDRMRRGYVVDYFSIQWKALKKVVFNLGDIFIFLGTFFIVVSELLETFKGEKQSF